jgi:hypothetical protein
MYGASKFDSLVETMLRNIAKACGDTNDWPEKYGTSFENDTFIMHPFCWCEKESCDYCGDKMLPNFHHRASGLKVWWYKYIGRDTVVNADWKGCDLWYDEIARDCINSVNNRKK